MHAFLERIWMEWLLTCICVHLAIESTAFRRHPGDSYLGASSLMSKPARWMVISPILLIPKMIPVMEKVYQKGGGGDTTPFLTNNQFVFLLNDTLHKGYCYARYICFTVLRAHPIPLNFPCIWLMHAHRCAPYYTESTSVRTRAYSATSCIIHLPWKSFPFYGWFCTFLMTNLL